MSIPREFITLLLSKLDIVDLINPHVPLKKKSGSNYFARCPFHNEKSASFSVSQTKQFYYCFGCGAHGNAIDFVMQHDHLTFPEAIETLSRQVGMEVPQAAAIKKNDPTPALLDLIEKVAEYYYQTLAQSSKAIHYLKQRGISGQIAKLFQLGYAPNHWQQLLHQFGRTASDKKLLAEAGLIIQKEAGNFYDRFRDRIIFPIQDYRGRFIGFGGRVIDQGEPKYLNSPETMLFQKGHELYGLSQVLKLHRQVDYILVVEGYMDVIALFQHGVTYAVATLGTATTSYHLKRLFRYTTEIIFCFDGDKAGRTAAWRALQVVLPQMNDSQQIRFLFLPEGEDPDTLIRKEGKAAFEGRLTGAASLSAFLFQTLSQQSDMQTIEGRAQFAATAKAYIQQVPKGIYQTMLIEELSKKARLDLAKLKQSTFLAKEPVIATINESPLLETLPQPIRLALALLIQHPSLVEKVTISDLPQQTLPGLKLLTHVISLIKQNAHLTTGSLLEEWRNEKEASVLYTLAHLDTMITEESIQQAFSDTMKQVLMLSYDNEINRLLAKATNEALSDEEKQALSTCIAKKKAILHIT